MRLAGVLVLVLLSRISNYFREMRRQGEFVYKTGRWFEQLDREVASLKQRLGELGGHSGTGGGGLDEVFENLDEMEGLMRRSASGGGARSRTSG